MAAMRQVPDLIGQEVTMSAGHELISWNLVFACENDLLSLFFALNLRSYSVKSVCCRGLTPLYARV